LGGNIAKVATVEVYKLLVFLGRASLRRVQQVSTRK